MSQSNNIMPNNTSKTTSSGTFKSWPFEQKLALAAFIYCVIVVLFMAITFYQSKKLNLIDSNEITVLKEQLLKQPADETLKSKIRKLDLEYRVRHEIIKSRMEKSSWVLLCGAIVMFLALRRIIENKRPGNPGKRLEPQPVKIDYLAILTNIGIFVTLLGIGFYYANSSVTNLVDLKPAQTSTNEQRSTDIPTTPYPSETELRQNWPRFRGFEGSGISIWTNIPVTWNVQTGENILWKVRIPLYGPNSPVVWEDRVFVTGATAKKQEIYCYELNSGKLIWRKEVENPQASSEEPPTVMEDSGGYCASTAAVDGRRIYAIFANGALVAIDLNGNQVWIRNFGKPDNSYGHGSSLELYKDRLIVQLDQGTGKDGKGKIYALDTKTGQTIWETDARPVPASWSTPIVINADNKFQIIACGNPWTISYDAETGKEIWRAKTLYGEVTPSPIFAGGLVITAIEGEYLSAIKPNGTGDVSNTHIAWKGEDGLPEISSPFSDGQRVYLATTSGTITCYELKSGNKLWDHSFDDGFQSSGSIFGTNAIIFSTKGKGFVFAASNEFKLISESDLAEEVLSSPAFAKDKMLIRGKQNLYCIGFKQR